LTRWADTIFALSSGSPPAAIAVMRVSGAGASAALVALAGRVPAPRRATLVGLRHPATGALLDQGLVLWFPGPNSATGEDLVELHLHGGRAVVAAVGEALAQCDGLRPAEPGEFTRRALTHGRLDLAQAEGLGDLLAAETESQRRAAIDAAEGVVSRAVQDWNQRLLALAARAEAMIDFSDEDDVDDAGIAPLRQRLSALAADIDEALANPSSDRLRDGVRVVLAGRPNAGKSTLLNALSQRDAAIVSPIAGTTRDRIEVPLVYRGTPYLLTDTAGLAASTDDPIERIGIERTTSAIATADIVIALDDSAALTHARVIRIRPKADLAHADAGEEHGLAVSAATGTGLAELWAAIAAAAHDLLPRLDRLTLTMRQQMLCRDARDRIMAAADCDDLLLLAEECRAARHALDRITGASSTEAMLDSLFSRFCIGK
jgi:tRNA modification GTPase